MKILITSPSLNLKHNVSGVAAVTSFIIKNNKSHQYTHFEIGKKDDQKRNIWWLFKLIALYFKWLIRILNPNINLIHFNFPVDKKSLLRDSPLILMSKVLKKKIVIHLHGGEYLLNNQIPSWAKKLITLTLSGKQPKIFLSKIERDFAVNNYKCENSFILPNTADNSLAANFNRDFTGTLKILFIGRICEEKGLNFIEKAFIKLKEENIPFKFYLAGKGPDESIYIENFRKILNEDFIFKGVVAGENKIELFKECNIFLLPSLFEGLPVALLEAMSFGQVPVVTNVGSIEEVVQHDSNGIIIKTKSSDQITEAIKHLYHHKDKMQKLGELAKKTIEENYNSDVYTSQLNKIYSYE